MRGRLLPSVCGREERAITTLASVLVEGKQAQACYGRVAGVAAAREGEPDGDDPERIGPSRSCT